MITELRIANFKSFGSGLKPLHLKPLNFIVGANASGKTNLINALRFLKLAVLYNVDYATKEFGGRAEVRNKIQSEHNKLEPMRIGIKVEGWGKWGMSGGGGNWDIRSMDYTLEIDASDENTEAQVMCEDLVVEQVNKLTGEMKLFKLKRSKNEVKVEDELNPGVPREFPSPKLDPTRLLLGSPFVAVQLIFLRRFIEGWSFFNIRPDVARGAFKDLPDENLGEYGERLAAVLHRIEKQDGDGTLTEIINGLRGAVPGFKSVHTVPVGMERSYAIVEERIKSALNPSSASDGTIRLLAILVAAFWQDGKSTLLVIEEPETGLHPHLSKHVMELLRASSQHRQVIATTHNPAFLDELEPDEVILCDKPEGYTLIHTAADVQSIKEFRKTFSLGELWNQGALGGTL